MKTLSGREFARLVERTVAVAAPNGRYHIYGKLDSIVRLSIPIHRNRPLKEQPCGPLKAYIGAWR